MDPNDHNTPRPEAPEPDEKRKSSTVELIRMALDFISKCLYPGIVIALMVILLPKLEQIDLQSLFGRLQSAKAGGYEFTFSQAQDVGAETAPLNSKVAELERTVGTLKSDISALQSKAGQVQPSTKKKGEQQAAEQKYQTNSNYTVLVFHRRESRKPSTAITNALLKAGFVSSDTETDFSEIQKIQPSAGLIYIMYNATGEHVLSDVAKRIESLGLNVKVETDPRPTDLRRGDLQVLVF